MSVLSKLIPASSVSELQSAVASHKAHTAVSGIQSSELCLPPHGRKGCYAQCCASAEVQKLLLTARSAAMLLLAMLSFPVVAVLVLHLS